MQSLESGSCHDVNSRHVLLSIPSSKPCLFKEIVGWFRIELRNPPHSLLIFPSVVCLFYSVAIGMVSSLKVFLITWSGANLKSQFAKKKASECWRFSIKCISHVAASFTHSTHIYWTFAACHKLFLVELVGTRQNEIILHLEVCVG